LRFTLAIGIIEKGILKRRFDGFRPFGADAARSLRE
jgi:hypothetical protein